MKFLDTTLGRECFKKKMNETLREKVPINKKQKLRQYLKGGSQVPSYKGVKQNS